MTATAPAGLSAEFASLPSLTLDEVQLGDLELLLTGAFAPLTGFMSGADVASVAEPVSYTHLDVYKRQGWNAAAPRSIGAFPDRKSVV